MAFCELIGTVKDYNGSDILPGTELFIHRVLPGGGSTTVFGTHRATHELKGDGTWYPLIKIERGASAYISMNAPGFDADMNNGTLYAIPNSASVELEDLAIIAAGGAVGSGTTGFIAKFLDTIRVASSVIQEAAGKIGIGKVPTTALDVDGVVKATSFEGSGAALTGITGATGGVSNTGSTTIGADNDANGAGVIALQTRNIDRLRIENDGQLTADDASGLENLDGSKISSTTVERDRFGRYYLRDLAAQIAKIRKGDNAIANIIWIGDSLTNSETITEPLRRMLFAQYGFAGYGFIRFDGSGGHPSFAVNTTGTWTETGTSGGDLNVTTAALGIHAAHVTSSSAGATKTISGANSFATKIRLLYVKKSGGGSFKYKIDSGSYTTINTSNGSTALGVETISGLSYGLHTLTVEVVSGSVSLIGADYELGSKGVKLHNLGRTGAKASFIANQANATIWEDQAAALNGNLFVIAFSANEQSLLESPATMVAAYTTLINRIRTALPLADILLTTDVDTANSDNPSFTPMADYAAAVQDLARSLGVGYIDFFKHFGPFDDADSRGLMTDSVHPDTVGSRTLAEFAWDYINSGAGSPFQGGSFVNSISIPYNQGGGEAISQRKSDESGNLWSLTNNGNSLFINLTDTSGGMNIGTASVPQEIHIAFLTATVLALGLGGNPSTRLHVYPHGGGVPAITAEGVAGQSAPVIKAVGGDIETDGVFKVDGTQVVSNRGAAVADATDNATAITQLNTLLARLRAHGLIAT